MFPFFHGFFLSSQTSYSEHVQFIRWTAITKSGILRFPFHKPSFSLSQFRPRLRWPCCEINYRQNCRSTYNAVHIYSHLHDDGRHCCFCCRLSTHVPLLHHNNNHGYADPSASHIKQNVIVIMENIQYTQSCNMCF